jgi:hypothetical protein
MSHDKRALAHHRLAQMLLDAWATETLLEFAMIAPADSYDSVQAEPATPQGYDDDLLLANWNPTLEVLATFRGSESDEARAASRASIESDLDGFLDRVYALATRI